MKRGRFGERMKTAEDILAEALRKSIEGVDVMNFMMDQHFGPISLYQHNLPMIRTYRTLRIGSHELVLLPEAGDGKSSASANRVRSCASYE